MILIGPGQGDALVLYDLNKNYDSVLVAPSSADIYWHYIDEPSSASRYVSTVPLDTEVVIPLSTEIDRDITIRAIPRTAYSPASAAQDLTTAEQVTAESDRLRQAVLTVVGTAGARFVRLGVDNWNRFSRVRRVDISATGFGTDEYTSLYWDLDVRKASGGDEGEANEFNELPDFIDIERLPPDYPASISWDTDTYFVRVAHSVQSSARATGATYRERVESLRYSDWSDTLEFDYRGGGAGTVGTGIVGLPVAAVFEAGVGSGLVDDLSFSAVEFPKASAYRPGILETDIPYGQYLGGRKVWGHQQIFAGNGGTLDDWTRDGGTLGPVKTSGLRTVPSLPTSQSLSYYADAAADAPMSAAQGAMRHDNTDAPARYHFYRSTHDGAGVTDDPIFFDTALALGRIAPAVWTDAAWRYSGRIDFALESAVAEESDVVPVAVDIYGGRASSDTTDATGTRGLRIDSRGDAVLGVGALAVDAVGGFAYLPQFVGTPTTSAPAISHSGYVALAMEGTALKAWNGSAWVGVSGANPAGSGSELQYRASAGAFGAVTDSSVSGANVTLSGGALTVHGPGSQVYLDHVVAGAYLSNYDGTGAGDASLLRFDRARGNRGTPDNISNDDFLGLIEFHGRVAGVFNPYVVVSAKYHSGGSTFAVSAPYATFDGAMAVGGITAPESGAGAHFRLDRFVIDSDAASTRFAVRSAGTSTFPLNSLVRSRGGFGTESVALSGDVLGLYGACSWDATNGWLGSQTGTLYFAAKENQSATNKGTAALIQTTPLASATRTARFAVEENGDVIAWVNTSAIATSATNGNLFVPHTAGLPTGVPTYAATYTAAIPVKIDSTNKRLYGYIGATWEALSSGPAGAGSELQYRNAGNFGAVSSSSVSGANITLGGTLSVTASDSLVKAYTTGLFEIARYSAASYPILKFSRTDASDGDISDDAVLGAIVWYGKVAGSLDPWISITGTYDNATGNRLALTSSVIHLAGNVGVGTAAPSTSLHVSGSVRFDLGSDADGDTYYRLTSNVSRLAIGTNGYFYKSNGSAPTWAALAAGDIQSGTLAIARGGTGLSATPTNGQLLIGNSGAYTQSTLTAGNNISVTNGGGTITIAATPTGSTTELQYKNGTDFGALSGSTVSGSNLYLGGTLGVGTATVSQRQLRVLYDVTATSTAYYGATFEVTSSPASSAASASLYGIWADVTTTTAQTHGTLTGALASINHGQASVLTDARGMDFSISQGSASGSITTLYGNKITLAIRNATTIYGAHITAQPNGLSGAVTTGYGYYAKADWSTFTLTTWYGCYLDTSGANITNRYGLIVTANGGMSAMGHTAPLASRLHIKGDGTYAPLRLQNDAQAILQEFAGANGEFVRIKQATALLEVNGGDGLSSLNASNLIPAGATLIAVTARVTQTFSSSTATSFDLGDNATQNLFGDNKALTAGTTVDSTHYLSGTWIGPKYYAAASDVIVTANGGTFSVDGRVRVTITYYDTTAPTG